jgi:hypothetical protein
MGYKPVMGECKSYIVKNDEGTHIFNYVLIGEVPSISITVLASERSIIFNSVV